MKTEFKKPFVSKAVLAGLFTGYIVTVADLFYNVIYRESVGYSRDLLVNVSSIIFGTMILSLALGFLFYFLARSFNSGRLLFTAIIFLGTLIVVGATLHFHWQDGIPKGSDGLLCGLEMITGFATAFLVPYFARHSEIFI